MAYVGVSSVLTLMVPYYLQAAFFYMPLVEVLVQTGEQVEGFCCCLFKNLEKS